MRIAFWCVGVQLRSGFGKYAILIGGNLWKRGMGLRVSIVDISCVYVYFCLIIFLALFFFIFEVNLFLSSSVFVDFFNKL